MRKIKMTPYMIIALSFFTVIILGTILLKLPITLKEHGSLSWIDAFFTSTSLITITGLTPVLDLGSSFTIFGKVVIACMIQIGGLSVLTLTVYIMTLIGSKIGFNNRAILKESLNQNSLQGLVKLVKRIIMISFIIEFIGFIINLFIFIPTMDNTYHAIGVSAFHAISAFNNAGLEILGFNNHFLNYHNNLLFNINTGVLSILGGLGVIVIYEVMKKRSWKKLSIQTKITLKMTLGLLIMGTVLFKLIEQNQMTFLEVSFLSINTRTAGFLTVDLTKVKSLSIAIIIPLMFIGAGPMSTGGGIKVTTLYVMLKSLFSFGRGSQTLTHKRLITDETKIKAFVLIQSAMILIGISTFLLLAFEETNIQTALFESVSAFSNTGMTLNFTHKIGLGSKTILILMMYIGRIGPLTILHLIYSKKASNSNLVYIDEKIVIG
ncbi:Trk system potassium uptake protein TrkG [Alteracholeplasma palmae J233]|uniref:Trk system potassium uptake protein TrkG n=1 Tax=Alteracholeplasma palmae (strain ATCC 49389 / J233) TaxID=1318466 RepID=U4KLK6_ALTPJ|nr:potassium transporter TrkG [Alteracholeplasma palmae]CCV64844.1 Trk system potassium uptake protein TrkG [Alteracholeplasma palmae J233]